MTPRAPFPTHRPEQAVPRPRRAACISRTTRIDTEDPAAVSWKR